jgi:hypothetical protein
MLKAILSAYVLPEAMFFNVVVGAKACSQTQVTFQYGQGLFDRARTYIIFVPC